MAQKPNIPASSSGSKPSAPSAFGNAAKPGSGGATATLRPPTNVAGVVESKAAPTPAQRPAADTAPTHAQIASAAYFRWQRHGGDAASNWAAAERELRAGMKK